MARMVSPDRVQQVPRRNVEAEDATGEYHVPLAGADGEDLDGGSLDGRAVRSEQDVIAVGQDLRPPMTQLAPRGVRRREHVVVAPALTHDPETGVVRPGVDQSAVPPPAAAGPLGRRQVDGRSALHPDLSELALSCVSDPLTVRRYERSAIARPLLSLAGTRDHCHAHLVERTPQDLLPPTHHRGHEELATVGAEAHDRREGGVHPRVELDVEAHRGCGERAGPATEHHPPDRHQQGRRRPGDREPAPHGERPPSAAARRTRAR